MNNLTTPMAILISGILIALVIAFKDNSPKYQFTPNGTSLLSVVKNNIHTGESCLQLLVPKNKFEEHDGFRTREWKYCE
jgi:hypothetical protein